MSTDNFREFLLSILNDKNANLVSELFNRWNEWLQEKEVKPVLFTTEDGVDIREGDNFYMLFTAPDGIGKAYVTRARKELLPLHIYQKTFSRKELAEHWILMNKPILSLNDILSVWDTDDEVIIKRDNPEYYAQAPLFLQFKKLAKNKINNNGN